MISLNDCKMIGSGAGNENSTHTEQTPSFSPGSSRDVNVVYFVLLESTNEFFENTLANVNQTVEVTCCHADSANEVKNVELGVKYESSSSSQGGNLWSWFKLRGKMRSIWGISLSIGQLHRQPKGLRI